MAALFFDERWWQSKLGEPAPGLAGAGNGLGLLPGPGGYVSELGYTIKRPMPVIPAAARDREAD